MIVNIVQVFIKRYQCSRIIKNRLVQKINSKKREILEKRKNKKKILKIIKYQNLMHMKGIIKYPFHQNKSMNKNRKSPISCHLNTNIISIAMSLNQKEDHHLHQVLNLKNPMKQQHIEPQEQQRFRTDKILLYPFLHKKTLLSQSQLLLKNL